MCERLDDGKISKISGLPQIATLREVLEVNIFALLTREAPVLVMDPLHHWTNRSAARPSTRKASTTDRKHAKTRKKENDPNGPSFLVCH